MSKPKLLELRKKIKSKKPHFVRQESHKRIKLSKKWRKPKGLHSKLRLRMRGYHKRLSTGYGSPKEVRHLHKSGLKIALVYSENDVKRLNKDENCAIIAKTVGMKKKIALLNKLKDSGIKVLNIKNIEDYIKKSEEKRKEKQEEKKKKKQKSEKKKKTDEKKKDKLAEKVLTEEEKKEKEKKEKDKLLTKKDAV